MTREEAIDIVRKNYPHVGVIGSQFETALQNLIPELRESEDERIRKWLSECVENLSDGNFIEVSRQDVLCYLEKQKDHFRDDTKMIGLQDYFGLNDLERAIHRGFLAAGVENVPVAIIKETAKECLEQMKPAEINIRALLSADRLASAEMTGRLKERSEILENPEEYGLHKPAEWSEGDEAMIKNILFVLESYVSHSESASSPSLITSYPTYYKEIAWLKSLRPVSKESLQPHWKPSEEQMEALKDAFRKDGGNEYRKVINSLYCDLQKLL